MRFKILILAICFAACTTGSKEQAVQSDSVSNSTTQSLAHEKPRTPSNATLEDGVYRIKPTLGSVFEYNAEREQEFKQLEELQKQIDKGELKFDDITTEQQAGLDDLGMSGGYWSIGVSPVPQWVEEFPFAKMWASSTLAPSKNATYEVSNLRDYDLRTVWSEGAPGNGLGEFISLQYPAKNQYGNETILTSVTFLNGFVRSNDLWKKNGRVKSFKFYINDNLSAYLDLDDSKAFQTFDLGSISSQDGFTIKFEIAEVYPGTAYEDVVISNLDFDGDGVLCFDRQTKISMTDGSFKSIDQVLRGDEIITFDLHNNTIGKAKVEAIGKAFHNNLVEIDLENRKIIATDDHPFLTEHNEWTAVKPSNNHINHLKAGVTLKIVEQNEIAISEVKSIRRISGNRLTYAIIKTSSNLPYLANGMWVAVEDPTQF